MQFLSISEESMVHVNSKFDRKLTSKGLDMKGLPLSFQEQTFHIFAGTWLQN